MTNQSLRAAKGRGTRRRHWQKRDIVAIVFAVLVLAGAGLAFVLKMSDFAITIVKGEISGFGVTAISVYLIGLLPILFLTLWAVFSGRFHDIERPKLRMLELDREIERGGDLSRQRHV